MPATVPYEDAIDLLDADHKAVKRMFIDYSALCDDQAPAKDKRALAGKICAALKVHTQIEEEIFYPAVRDAIADDALMDEAVDEHAQAKEMIERIGASSSDEATRDDLVKQLAKAIDEHVGEEREQIFLKARYSPLDLRGLAVPLFKRQQQLKKSGSKEQRA